jgi:heavy metal sensor kinase
MLVGYSGVLSVSLGSGLYAGLDRIINDEARQALGVLNAVHSQSELDEEFQRINVGTFVGLYDASGQRLIAGRALPPPLDRAQPATGASPRLQTSSAGDGTSWRVLVQKVSIPGQPERQMVVARSAVYVGIAVNQLNMLIGVTLAIALLLAVGGGFFMASRALGPIDQITRTAEAISADDLSRRLDLPRAPDEVGRLAASFERMLDRLDRAFDQQRRFTADASHELRTPIAMLVSRAGLALERPRAEQDYVRILGEIRDDSLRMSRIVNDLLTLARADASEFVGPVEPLDTGELIAAVVDSMRSLAAERGVNLEMRVEQSPVVIGDQTRLMQLLINLIDNALGHTPAGGTVRISSDARAASAVIKVTDTGCGIASEHLPHVFERFFRGDRDTFRQRAGAGLGLALCLSIARAHGGDIHITSEVSHGTEVTVRLPIAPPATLMSTA